MNTQKNLNQLQQRVIWAYHQDGLVDILFGLGVIGFGLMMQTGVIVFNILAWIPAAFYVSIKKAVTIPRFGYVKIQTQRTLRWALFSLFLGAGFLALLLALIPLIRSGRLPQGLQAMLRDYDMLMIGALLSIPLLLISALTGLRRLLGYVGLIMLGILAGIWLGISPPMFMMAIGAAILIVGLVYLGRFLNRYPLHQPELQNGA